MGEGWRARDSDRDRCPRDPLTSDFQKLRSLNQNQGPVSLDPCCEETYGTLLTRVAGEWVRRARRAREEGWSRGAGLELRKGPATQTPQAPPDPRTNLLRGASPAPGREGPTWSLVAGRRGGPECSAGETGAGKVRSLRGYRSSRSRWWASPAWCALTATGCSRRGSVPGPDRARGSSSPVALGARRGVLGPAGGPLVNACRRAAAPPGAWTGGTLPRREPTGSRCWTPGTPAERARGGRRSAGLTRPG